MAGVGFKAEGRTAIKQAVMRRAPDRRQALLDQLFAMWFSRFVYNQIWEDPAVDLEALQVGPDSRIVTIASGGCNIMNYLAADPASIVAVDLNPAHIALTRLKLAAIGNLPDHEALFQFFGVARNPDNVGRYFSHIVPHLDAATRSFWEQRSLIGGQRIDFFAKGLYKKALLGRFIGFLHAVAKLVGHDVSRILDARNMAEQRSIYAQEIEPLFNLKLVRFLARQPVVLYSLGIPPNQFSSMKEDSSGDLAQLYEERIRRLACDFDLSNNYFAWQAFGRRYDVKGRSAVPPYLREDAYEATRSRVSRVETHLMSMTDYLQSQPEQSQDRYVLLDSVDWMDARMLGALWEQIRRTARPGARMICRTAGWRSPFEVLLDPKTLQGWSYREDESRKFLTQDRSSIYGGFHLYVRD